MVPTTGTISHKSKAVLPKTLFLPMLRDPLEDRIALFLLRWVYSFRRKCVFWKDYGKASPKGEVSDNAVIRMNT